MQVAQQFLAALARDWDGPLSALKEHLDQQGSKEDKEDKEENRQ
jgi:hypothetical protein